MSFSTNDTVENFSHYFWSWRFTRCCSPNRPTGSSSVLRHLLHQKTNSCHRPSSAKSFPSSMSGAPPLGCIQTPPIPIMPLFPDAGSLQGRIQCHQPGPNCPQPIPGGPGTFMLGVNPGPFSGPQVIFSPMPMNQMPPQSTSTGCVML